ncbi:Headcase protein [Melipona quadrifasciata]|uniref:Headcase protein n=1 Tax=Melipona quadrifasciata TaxID=166423 RepID=A0A0M9AA04_9HYME|nr:Headcase protein [Melipona quadrifasciata]
MYTRTPNKDSGEEVSTSRGHPPIEDTVESVSRRQEIRREPNSIFPEIDEHALPDYLQSIRANEQLLHLYRDLKSPRGRELQESIILFVIYQKASMHHFIHETNAITPVYIIKFHQHLTYHGCSISMGPNNQMRKPTVNVRFRVEQQNYFQEKEGRSTAAVEILYTLKFHLNRALEKTEKFRTLKMIRKGKRRKSKACGCRCGRGHLKKDLDWIPPGSGNATGNRQDENEAKKKKRRNRQNTRPTLAVSAGPPSHGNHVSANGRGPTEVQLIESSRGRAGSLSSSTGSSSPPATSEPSVSPLHQPQVIMKKKKLNDLTLKVDQLVVSIEYISILKVAQFGKAENDFEAYKNIIICYKEKKRMERNTLLDGARYWSNDGKDTAVSLAQTVKKPIGRGMQRKFSEESKFFPKPPISAIFECQFRECTGYGCSQAENTTCAQKT